MRSDDADGPDDPLAADRPGSDRDDADSLDDVDDVDCELCRALRVIFAGDRDEASP